MGMEAFACPSIVTPTDQPSSRLPPPISTGAGRANGNYGQQLNITASPAHDMMETIELHDVQPGRNGSPRRPNGPKPMRGRRSNGGVMHTSPPSNSASLQSSPLNTPQIRGRWVQEGRPARRAHCRCIEREGDPILRVAAPPFSPAQAPLRASPRSSGSECCAC